MWHQASYQSTQPAGAPATPALQNKKESAHTIRSPRLTDPTPSRRADKGPVPCQEPPLDPLLNAAKDPTPLRSSDKVAYAFGTLYSTSRWSPVVMASLPLADLVP